MNSRPTVYENVGDVCAETHEDPSDLETEINAHGEHSPAVVNDGFASAVSEGIAVSTRSKLVEIVALLDADDAEGARAVLVATIDFFDAAVLLPKDVT